MRKLFRKLRLRFGYYTLDDVVHAIKITGNAKDRDDFEWKLQNRLKDMAGAK